MPRTAPLKRLALPPFTLSAFIPRPATRLQVDAIVFLVDAADRERFAESKKVGWVGDRGAHVEAAVGTAGAERHHFHATLSPSLRHVTTISVCVQELDSLLGDDGLSDVPFLILGNKIDIPSAASGELGVHFAPAVLKVPA